MAKLGVGVGDEFPAKEVRDGEPDETPVVHHHHYYRRRRRGRFLLIVLWVLVISAVFRALDALTGPPTDYGRWGGGYGAWRYHPMEGLLTAIGVIAILLWLVRCRQNEERR